jgi:hypothetical protein
MTAISLGHAARPDRLGRTAVTAAIKVGRLATASGRYSVGEPFGVRNAASRPREFASGFVDFLLGRGARHPR